MTVPRAVIAIACISVGIAVAVLWDPTVRVQPSYLPENPNPPSDYFSHQFVPLRVAIAVAGLLIAILVLTVRTRRAAEHSGSANGAEA